MKTEPGDLLDVVLAAVEELGAPARPRRASLDIPEDLPLVSHRLRILRPPSPICKAFIEAHHGRVTLESNPVGGTIARFVIPFHEAEKPWPSREL